ncbi:cell division protein SepF [Paenibacillus daejeonensis]|uniref:cell division protein SepF n=1 Tax=Paenibacillus daejeonensis TaxID=135193 RepID=UPI00035F6EE3|nr:cell division protein SepF [Paenibacillus daejeonensis]
MGVMDRIMNLFGLQEEEVVIEREKVTTPAQQDESEQDSNSFESRRQQQAKSNNVVSIHSQKNTRVVLIEPRTYDEAQEIADHLRSRRPVIVNLQRVRTEQAVRVVDFLSGTVYALNGNISKLGPNIFLCTPDSVEIQGTITEMMAEDVDYNKMR